jgi:hypothetical protein
MGERVDGIIRVRGWDEDRFERHIHEWAFTLQKRGLYRKVVWAPGSGDKGRDVRAYVTDETGEWDNFQCKFYKNPLTPGDVWLELAKLCYYTHRRDFTTPRKYYFVAPHDLGPSLSGLIGDGGGIRKLLLDEWVKTGKDTISGKLAPLDARLRTYVDAFDFSIITFKSQRDILDDLAGTEYYSRVFGCGGLVRPRPEPIPDQPAATESNYLEALLSAFAEHLQIDRTALTEEVLQNRPDLVAYLRVSRTSFYSAEQLHRFGRDSFPTSHCFEDLQEQVYVGVLGVAMGPHADGFAKVIAVTTEAGKLDLGNHFLVGLKLVEVQDRHGICHQIVNMIDGRLVWVVNPRGNGDA